MIIRSLIRARHCINLGGVCTVWELLLSMLSSVKSVRELMMMGSKEPAACHNFLFYCEYCSEDCDSQQALDEHCQTSQHVFNVTSDNQHQWNCRPPPWTTNGQFSLCQLWVLRIICLFHFCVFLRDVRSSFLSRFGFHSVFWKSSDSIRNEFGLVQKTWFCSDIIVTIVMYYSCNSWVVNLQQILQWQWITWLWRHSQHRRHVII